MPISPRSSSSDPEERRLLTSVWATACTARRIWLGPWREYQTAIKLAPNNTAIGHYGLGLALLDQGRLDEAIAENREAIRLKKDYAEAHCNLGGALQRKGLFAEGVVYLRRGHELGSRQPGWRWPSAECLRNAEYLADLDARLPALIKGQEQPKDARQRLTLAQMCQLQKTLFAASTRWYSEAFAAETKLADDLNTQNRYNAACAAALAGCGQGKDADKLDAKEALACVSKPATGCGPT